MPTPCIYTKNSVLTLLDASFSLSLLADTSESISSINMILYFYSLAILNNVLIDLADSPTNFDIKSEELTEKKVASAYVAHAFAKNVLPVPGGPYKRIPFQGFLNPTKISGNLVGSIIASCNCFLAYSRPATSSHLTFGFSVTIAPLRALSLFS